MITANTAQQAFDESDVTRLIECDKKNLSL
jgi:hypothetical protein